MLVFVIPAFPVVVPVIVFPDRVRLYYPGMGDELRGDEMSRNCGAGEIIDISCDATGAPPPPLRHSPHATVPYQPMETLYG